jgi:arylsulfatase A
MYPISQYLPGKMFRNTTLRGGFGDALAEMDDAVGRIMSALSISGQRNNTLVIFTSDNGQVYLSLVFRQT